MGIHIDTLISGSFYVKISHLIQRQGSLEFARFGAQFWNSLHVSLRDLSKVVFKKESYYTLFSVLKDDDDYVKTYTLLEKMAKFVVQSFKILFMCHQQEYD